MTKYEKINDLLFKVIHSTIKQFRIDNPHLTNSDMSKLFATPPNVLLKRMERMKQKAL